MSSSSTHSESTEGAPQASSFDPAFQHGDVDAKLVAGLERLGQVFRVLLWDAARAHNLSPIQIRMLIDLRFRAETGRRVGAVAQAFDLTPATVSDAIQTLSEKGLVEKVQDPTDRRARIVTLTDAGVEKADALSTWAKTVRSHLQGLDAERKTVAMEMVMDLIASLEHAGVVSRARMCKTCRFFASDVHDRGRGPHHCRLLDVPLGEGDLRMDCPEHELPDDDTDASESAP